MRGPCNVMLATASRPAHAEEEEEEEEEEDGGAAAVVQGGGEVPMAGAFKSARCTSSTALAT